ncbi:MAG: EAL domain-containing protein, partial [Bacillota bacterium]|nr:EAL domain-containing protein [Bacillota bacterium]
YNSMKKDASTASEKDMKHLDTEILNIIEQKKEDTKFLSTNPLLLEACNEKSVEPEPFNMEEENSSLYKDLYKDLYGEFERYGNTHPEVQYVYMGTASGGYILWPKDRAGLKSDFDPRLRPWYVNAVNNPGSVVFTEPYISLDYNHTVSVSTSTCIRDDSGRIAGVLSIDVNLKILSQLVNSKAIGSKGYIFLYDKNGTIITHPDAELIYKNIKDLNSNDKETFMYAIKDYGKFLDGKSTEFETSSSGKPVIVKVYTSSYTGWKMASVIAKSELLKKANDIGYAIASVVFCFIVASILVANRATKRITKPLTEMTTLMQLAGNGNLNVKSKIESTDEFGQLARSFNSMINKLYVTYEELTSVHEELIATDDELRTQYDELQQKEEALRLSDERHRLALDGSNDAIWEWNLQSNDFSCSDKWQEILGHPPREKLTLQFLISEAVHPDDVDKAAKRLDAHLTGITDFFNAEFRVKQTDGSYKWIYCRGKALRDVEDNPTKMAGSVTDISLRKESEEKMRHMAFYDSLTDFPNRTLFMKILTEELVRSNSGGEKGAVLFIDLDNFKYINDTLGHDYGDRLLQVFAEKLKTIKKSYDTLCRLGGDEFIILHPFKEDDDIEAYAEELLDIFNNTFEVQGKQTYVTASIGIALYPRDSIEANTLLKDADTAMYKAKELGKSTYSIFDNEMYLHLERKTHVEAALRTALVRKEFFLHYQPQYNIESMEISGFEALLRLNSSELGFISPAEFIPTAEDTGHIVDIGEWVLREACTRAMEWQRRGFKFGYVGINLSPVQIQQPDFLDKVRKLIEDTGINPESIELEITETFLMKSLDENMNTLHQLRDMGFKIALDDFGTGYSSLNYLRTIPIDTLKIDKSFIDDIRAGNKEEAIIESIIHMAHSMNLTVVAEGIETELQVSLLREKQCDRLQGYLFSRPLPVSEIEKLYAQK